MWNLEPERRGIFKAARTNLLFLFLLLIALFGALVFVGIAVAKYNSSSGTLHTAYQSFLNTGFFLVVHVGHLGVYASLSPSPSLSLSLSPSPSLSLSPSLSPSPSPSPSVSLSLSPSLSPSPPLPSPSPSPLPSPSPSPSPLPLPLPLPLPSPSLSPSLSPLSHSTLVSHRSKITMLQTITDLTDSIKNCNASLVLSFMQSTAFFSCVILALLCVRPLPFTLNHSLSLSL